MCTDTDCGAAHAAVIIMADNKQLQKIPVLRDVVEVDRLPQSVSALRVDTQTQAYWRWVWRFELAAKAIR